MIIMNKFTESSWKVILTLIIIIVAIFALFGLIGKAIEKIMYKQGQKIDKFMSPLILTSLVDNEKDFVKIAKFKSRLYFIKTSIIPLILIISGLLIWIIYHSLVGRWDESIFNDYSGIGTLFYTWDFSNITYYPPLGFGNVTLQNTPHFLKDIRMINYFIFLFIFIGLIWYLINVQAYIARLLRINKLRNKIFSKNLENIDLTTIF